MNIEYRILKKVRSIFVFVLFYILNLFKKKPAVLLRGSAGLLRLLGPIRLPAPQDEAPGDLVFETVEDEVLYAVP